MATKGTLKYRKVTRTPQSGPNKNKQMYYATAVTDRELVNRIQNIRKSSGFEITDKIKITISKNTQTDDAVNEYNTYICNQVLGTSLELVDEVKDGTELSFDDFSLFVNVIKD